MQHRNKYAVRRHPCGTIRLRDGGALLHAPVPVSNGMVLLSTSYCNVLLSARGGGAEKEPGDLHRMM
eukprot:8131636-Pyramimonas_sp.AAC.1